MGLNWNSRGGGGGFKPKNFPFEGYGYYLEQHNLMAVLSFSQNDAPREKQSPCLMLYVMTSLYKPFNTKIMWKM